MLRNFGSYARRHYSCVGGVADLIPQFSRHLLCQNWKRQRAVAGMQMTKLEAAKHQLAVAIQLFFNEDYLSSLTLAGAAEEILGKLSMRAGKPVAVDEITRYHADDIDAAIPEGQRKAVLPSILNRGRNQAKHANDPEEAHVVFDHTQQLEFIEGGVSYIIASDRLSDRKTCL